MKKFKKFLSNKKNVSKSETTLAQSAMAKKGSMLSLGSKTTGDYEIKPKDLDKIHKAVIDKDVKKVEKLAIKGVNSRDAQDRTPMHLACSIGDKEVVATLLSFKPLLTVPDKQHKIPLFKAIEGGFSEIANMLVTAQKDLKAVDHDGNTCLHYASIYGLADVTKSILNKMPVNSVNVANKTGKTALHLAVANNHAETVKNLISKGANLKATDNQGDTPTSIAKIQNNENVMKALSMNESPLSRSNKSSSLSSSNTTSSNNSAEEIESKPVIKANKPTKPAEKSISDDYDDSTSFSSKSSFSKKQSVPKPQFLLKQPSSSKQQAPMKAQSSVTKDSPMKSPPKSPKNDDRWLSDSQSQISSDSEEDDIKKKTNKSDLNEKIFKNENAPTTNTEIIKEKAIKPTNNSDFDSDSDDGGGAKIPQKTPVKKNSLSNDPKKPIENFSGKLDSRKDEMVEKPMEDETKNTKESFLEKSHQKPETSKTKTQEKIDDSPWDSSDDEDEEAEKKPSINTVMTTIPQKKISFSFDTSDEEDKEETQIANEKNKAPKISETNKRMSSVENHIPSLTNPAVTSTNDSKIQSSAHDQNEKKNEEKATEDKRKASTTSSKLSFLRKLSVGPVLSQKKKGRKIGVVDNKADENDKNYENGMFNMDTGLRNDENDDQNSDGNDDYDDLLEKFKMAEKELDVSKRVEESLKIEKKNLINEMKDLRESHGEKLNELTAKIVELEKNNRAVIETKEVSTRKEEFLASEVDRLASENDALKSLNDELHQKMMEDEHNEGNEAVINELHLLRDKLQMTENDLQNANMRITSQQEKNIEGNGFLSEKVKQLSSQLQQQEAICLDHKRELAQQKSQIKSLEIEIEELNKKKALKDSEWNDVKRQLSNKNVELESIKDERNYEKDTRMKVELELASLNEKLEKEREKWNDKAKENNVESFNQVSLIQEEVNSMKEKNDMLKKTIEKVKDESKNREELLKREIDKLEKERDTLFEKHLKVESSIQSASMSKKLKEGEITDLKEEIESLKALVERGKIKEKNLESKIEDLNKNIRDFKAKEGVHWEEEEERRKLVERVQKLEVDKVRLSAELRNERVEIDRLRDQLEIINNEDERLRRSLERKTQAEVKLKIEREKIESLEQQLNHYKQTSQYEKSMKPVRKFLIDNARKKDDERILELIETLRNKLQQDTKRELLAKVQQVTTFLDEQTVMKTSGEERKSEWASQNDKGFDGSLFAKRMQELRTCLNQLKKSEALLINRLNHPFNPSDQKMNQSFSQSSHLMEFSQLNGLNSSPLNYSSHNLPKSFEYLNDSEDKTYTTKKLLKQLEASINNYNSEKL